MKGKLFALLLTLLPMAQMQADNTISVSASDGKPGAEIEVAVSMTNTDDIVAAEFQIPLDDNLTYVDKSFEMEADRLNGHKTSVAYADNVLKVYVYNTSLTALPKSSGKFFSFKVKLGGNPGKYAVKPTVILSDKSGKKTTCSVTGTDITILAPQIGCNTESIDFGHVAIKSKYEKTIVLTNTGTSTLTVSSVTSSSDAFFCSESSFSIEAGKSKELTIVFAPLQHGATNGRLTIESDAVNGTQYIELTADPYSVNELHVGNVSGKYNTEVTVALDMTNMEKITAVQCSFDLPEELDYVANSFTVSDRCSGFKSTSSVTGNKLNVYLYSLSGNVISAGEGEVGTMKLKLNGATGSYQLTPVEVVLGNEELKNMTSATTSGTVTIISPQLSCDSELDMSSVSLTETATQTFTIANTGQSELTVTSVTFSDDSLSVSDSFPIVIEAGSSHTLNISYRPHEIGEFSEVMNIYSDNPLERLTKVDISGTVYEPNTMNISSSLSEDKSTYNVTVSMDNYSDIVALQVDIDGVEGLTTSKSDLTLHDRCKDFSSVVSKNEDGSYRVIIYSLTNTPISGHNGNIFSLAFKDSLSGVIGTHNITLKNMVLSNDRNENMISDTTTEAILLGDANGNGVINVADISAVVSYIYGNTPTGFNIKAADANSSGSINVADITEIVNLIYNK